MKKYLSRKFILTMTALLGCFYFMFTKDMEGMAMAAVIAAVAGLVGQYSVSNGFGKDKDE